MIVRVASVCQCSRVFIFISFWLLKHYSLVVFHAICFKDEMMFGNVAGEGVNCNGLIGESHGVSSHLTNTQQPLC